MQTTATQLSGTRCFHRSAVLQPNSEYSLTILEFVEFTFTIIMSSHFLDLLEINGTRGGDAYKTFGISAESPAIVVVRPDGYIGCMAPVSVQGVDHLHGYLSGIMNEVS